MLIPRKTQARRGQVLVSLPAAVRHHLTVYGVTQVYWHVRVKGEVTLTTLPTRRGGAGAGTAGCAGCAERDEEVRKLTARLATAEAVGSRHLFAQGYALAYKQDMAFTNRLGVIVEMLRGLGAREPRPRKPRSRHVQTVAAAVPEAGPVSEEKKEAADVPVASAEAARDVIQGSESPPRAEE